MTTWRTAALLGLGGLLVGCGENPTELTLQNLAGTWSATKLEWTDNSNGNTFDLIANGGSFTIIVQETGAYTATFKLPGVPTETLTGTIVITGDLLEIVDDSDPSRTITATTFTFTGDTITFTDPSNSFDFDFDQQPEAATLVGVLTRVS